MPAEELLVNAIDLVLMLHLRVEDRHLHDIREPATRRLEHQAQVVQRDLRLRSDALGRPELLLIVRVLMVQWKRCRTRKVDGPPSPDGHPGNERHLLRSTARVNHLFHECPTPCSSPAPRCGPP